MLLPVDLNKSLINEESVSVSLMFPSQSLGIFRTKIVAPQPNGFIAHINATLWHQIFDISMAEIESAIEPNSVLDDFKWESMAFVYWFCWFHGIITARAELTWQYPANLCNEAGSAAMLKDESEAKAWLEESGLAYVYMDSEEKNGSAGLNSKN